MIQEVKELINEVSKLDPAQRGPYQTWLIIMLIRDIAYYAVAGIVAFALGRRLIHAILTAYRESRRERA
jgi:hypothetical protein